MGSINDMSQGFTMDGLVSVMNQSCLTVVIGAYLWWERQSALWIVGPY